MDLRYWQTGLGFAFRHRALRVAALLAAISLAVMAIVGIRYWLPYADEARKLESAVERQRRETANAIHASGLAQAYREALAQVDTIETKLDNDGGQAKLVQQLSRLAAHHRVKIASETYEEGKPRSGVVPLFLSLSVHADYRSLRGFLAALATLPMWTVIQEATLARADRGDIKAQLRLVTYRKAGS